MNKDLTPPTGFTLDTCVVINICENPNLADLLKCRIDFGDSPVYLSSQTINEAQRYGFDLDTVVSVLKQRLGTPILCESVTSQMYHNALEMENRCSTLHSGDSEILAFSISKGTTLVSCDKGLISAANTLGCSSVNPDILPSNSSGLPAKALTIVKKTARRTTRSSMKVKSIALMSGKKIVWNTFN